ncbi:RNA polymerase sigma factor [Sorangium sp. So ce861]|uniref:RNA polymerase sigma factor n=1 Tax=Sorangium sp. So ce861 TaxID=3133323 RepID=UPI003F62A414
MQEILLSAWRTVDAGGFHARDGLSVQEALRRWLFAVTWHHTTHYREHRHRWDKGRASFTHPAMDGHMPPPFEQVDARLTLRVLQRLKPDLRAVLAEAALGYTATEIAVELRKNPHTTLGRIHRGRRRFREALRRWRVMRCPGDERQGRAG